jgi:sigma-B regulation protein RsbU (phosphoserine phosphatase)
MQQELTTAREMQNLIMPIEPDIIDIEKNHNVSIGSFFKPSYEMGGDFWGINSADNDIVDLYAVDFSGHGVTAAINTFRLHTIMYSSIGRLSAGEYLEYLNKKITPLISSDQFATMFFGTIDSRTNKLTYATAGTTDAILVTNNMTEIITLDGSGFPIGITTSSKYDTKEIEFNKNDMLILYSDALIETPNNKKEFFLTEHIVDFLAENIKNSKSYNARHAVSDILTEFNNKYSHNLNDDLTLVAVSR